MFSSKSLKFLERFMNCSGPSGFETESAQVFRDYIEEFCENVSTDLTGNTIGVLNPEAEFKFMLAGHYDEIGFQVTNISDEGYLFFRKVGGIDNLTVPGTEIEVLTEDGKRIPGVIGKKPIHLVKAKDRKNAPELESLWIDIGAESGKDARKKVYPGAPVAVKSNFEKLGKYKIKSKGMDDKIGAFIVAETLKKLKNRKINLGVYGVGTVQEELGLRGAATSAFGISPNAGIAVDVGFATDIPDVSEKHYGDVKLGNGPIIPCNADNNPVLRKLMLQTVKKKNIKHQLTAGHSASGGTDTARIQLTKSGVATALVSIPNRYMHTPVELCDIRDVENAVKLIVETICLIKPEQGFIPGVD